VKTLKESLEAAKTKITGYLTEFSELTAEHQLGYTKERMLMENRCWVLAAILDETPTRLQAYITNMT
jgi:hypothetical protein